MENKELKFYPQLPSASTNPFFFLIILFIYALFFLFFVFIFTEITWFLQSELYLYPVGGEYSSNREITLSPLPCPLP
jgi:hypothetical protein